MGSISGSVDVDITGGGNPLPSAGVSQEITVSNDTGAGTSVVTGSSIDLGTVAGKFTLALGANATFSPSFTTDVASYVAAHEANPGWGYEPGMPIPVGTVLAQLYGSLDGTNWYELTSVTGSVVTSDGETAVFGTVAANTSLGTLARYLQVAATVTLSGNFTLSVAYSPEYVAFSANEIVTELVATVSAYVATDTNG